VFAEGAAHVYSGSNGALLYDFSGSTQNTLFGASVATADLNGDGRPDILIRGRSSGVSGTLSGPG
jgi:hypothetical protein